MRCGKDNFINELEGIFNLKNLEECCNIVFIFSALTLGNGDKILGNLLMETYLHAMTELDLLPKTIILYNEAVLFSIDSSKENIYMKKLQNRGVEILICNTSARYYNICKKINIGQTVSMKTIIEKKMAATKLILL